MEDETNYIGLSPAEPHPADQQSSQIGPPVVTHDEHEAIQKALMEKDALALYTNEQLLAEAQKQKDAAGVHGPIHTKNGVLHPGDHGYEEARLEQEKQAANGVANADPKHEENKQEHDLEYAKVTAQIQTIVAQNEGSSAGERHTNIDEHVLAKLRTMPSLVVAQQILGQISAIDGAPAAGTANINPEKLENIHEGNIRPDPIVPGAHYTAAKERSRQRDEQFAISQRKLKEKSSDA